MKTVNHHDLQGSTAPMQRDGVTMETVTAHQGARRMMFFMMWPSLGSEGSVSIQSLFPGPSRNRRTTGGWW